MALEQVFLKTKVGKSGRKDIVAKKSDSFGGATLGLTLNPFFKLRGRHSARYAFIFTASFKYSQSGNAANAVIITRKRVSLCIYFYKNIFIGILFGNLFKVGGKCFTGDYTRGPKKSTITGSFEELMRLFSSLADKSE